ncbi:quinol oxidase subunit 1 [Ceratobasidium sp. AG-Ba]|nr:quinol oxidase subunit 1 [Ceratobasidium sp. AG-Ba]
MPPRPHPSGRPRCNACIRYKNKCFRELPRCRACVRANRECVYEPEEEDPPPPPQQPVAYPAPAGIRQPRDFPTEWGTDESDLTDPPSRQRSPPGARDPRRTRLLGSLLEGPRIGQKRQASPPELDPLEERRKRAGRLQEELDAEMKAIQDMETQREKVAQRDAQPPSAMGSSMKQRREAYPEHNRNLPGRKGESIFHSWHALLPHPFHIITTMCILYGALYASPYCSYSKRTLSAFGFPCACFVRSAVCHRLYVPSTHTLLKANCHFYLSAYSCTTHRPHISPVRTQDLCLYFYVPIIERVPSVENNSSDSDDTVVPGYKADGADYPPPLQIVRLLKQKWNQHFSLALLRDVYCARMATSRQTGKALSSSSNEYVDKSLPELEMSYDEWNQAVWHFKPLLRKYLPHYLECWTIHFNYIDSRPTRSTQWSLWLEYCINVRQQTRVNRKIDVTVFQHSVWNDILASTLIRQKNAITNASGGLSSRLATVSDSSNHQNSSRSSSYWSKHNGMSSSNTASGRCFRCGVEGHNTPECKASSQANGKPFSIQPTSDKNWTLNGEPFC